MTERVYEVKMSYGTLRESPGVQIDGSLTVYYSAINEKDVRGKLERDVDKLRREIHSVHPNIPTDRLEIDDIGEIEIRN